MKEALFIFVVVAVLVAFTAYKYRKQIRTVREFWRMAQQIRQAQTPPTREVKEAPIRPAGKLVNCSKCGTWVPDEKAVRLGRSTVFCSSGCLEKAARIG